MTIMRRLSALLLTVAMLLSLAACGGGTDTSSAPPTTTTEPTTTTTTAPKLGLNKLTGIEDMQTDNDRPIGIVVTDENSSLVQLNLESADMYFEAETEGGIPRILAIYSSVDRLPDEIGPVRSARPHFVKFAKSLDMIYCHIGGSTTGLKTIKNLGVQDIGNADVISPILKNSKNFSWNRKVFTKAKIEASIKNNGFKKTSNVASPYVFGTKAGVEPANTVVVKISESYNMAFTYDAARGVYQKHRNALSTPVHTTYTGGTIEVSNVIIMWDSRFVDAADANRYDFTLEQGTGTLASGGTCRSICWKRTNSGLQYFESDGTTPLTVSTGKTFVCLASNTLRSGTVIY